jgi:hypothetical protein
MRPCSWGALCDAYLGDTLGHGMQEVDHGNLLRDTTDTSATGGGSAAHMVSKGVFWFYWINLTLHRTWNHGSRRLAFAGGGGRVGSGLADGKFRFCCNEHNCDGNCFSDGALMEER